MYSFSGVLRLNRKIIPAAFSIVYNCFGIHRETRVTLARFFT